MNSCNLATSSGGYKIHHRPPQNFLRRHLGHFQKHGVRKNDASILVTDDDALVERFENASHLMEPLRLSCWHETSPIAVCESDVRLSPVNVTTGKNLTALERWRILVDGLIQIALLCRPKNPVLLHPRN